MLISDHINLQGANPLIGPNDDALGPRFPDMSEAYARGVPRHRARRWPTIWASPLPEGVYAALLGPSYETPAEIRYLRAIGADLVGMSTVPEVIAANHMGMKVLAISCVTNMAAGVLPQKLNHEEVLEAGAMVRRDPGAVPSYAVASPGMTDELIAAALAVRQNAFAPFSQFPGGRRDRSMRPAASTPAATSRMRPMA